MERLNASIGFDRRLYREDIEGSIAWAEALEKTGMLTAEERAELAGGLEKVRREIEEGRFAFSERLEDIHMNVEARLTEITGEVGAKLHTGRSRNDQVATDLRLWVREHADGARSAVGALIRALVDFAEAHIHVAIPAYTHLQRAQPVLLAHHVLAWAEMFLRDRARFAFAREQANVCPLGSGPAPATSSGSTASSSAASSASQRSRTTRSMR